MSVQPDAVVNLPEAEAALLELARALSPKSIDSKPRVHSALSVDDRYRALIEQVPAVVFFARNSPRQELLVGIAVRPAPRDDHILQGEGRAGGRKVAQRCSTLRHETDYIGILVVTCWTKQQSPPQSPKAGF